MLKLTKTAAERPITGVNPQVTSGSRGRATVISSPPTLSLITVVGYGGILREAAKLEGGDTEISPVSSAQGFMELWRKEARGLGA